MGNAVTQRFVLVHNHLLSNEIVKSSRRFAQKLEYQPQNLNEILKGRRDASVTLILRMIQTFNVNPKYLFGKSAEMFLDESKSDNSQAEIVVITDLNGREKIVHVPRAAQAGYTDQHNEAVFIQDLQSFSLPDDRYDYGTHRCFDVAGDSMEPTLYAGDKIIGSFIEPQYWSSAVKDNLVYILVTIEDVLVKRVINCIDRDQEIKCYSDNNFYEPFSIPVEKLKEVWSVHTSISSFMQSPNHIRNGFHEQIANLGDVISQQSLQINSLNATVEKLLKQSRSMR